MFQVGSTDHEKSPDCVVEEHGRCYKEHGDANKLIELIDMLDAQYRAESCRIRTIFNFYCNGSTDQQPVNIYIVASYVSVTSCVSTVLEAHRETT